MTYLAALMAEKTGWSEKKILSMPFFKLLSYVHVFNIRAGMATDWARLDRQQSKIAREKFNAIFEK